MMTGQQWDGRLYPVVLVIAEQQNPGLIQVFPELMVKLGTIPLTICLNFPHQMGNIPTNMYLFAYKMHVIWLPGNYRVYC